MGRHNAVDKVVGELLNANQLKESLVMLVSGKGLLTKLSRKPLSLKFPLW